LIYHVLNRSVAGIQIFRTDKDFLAFERVLVQSLAKFPVDLLAYSVMPNHWHLVLRPREDGDLSRFMQWLTLTHVQRWRTSHQNVGYGPLYQGRFKAFPIQQDEHLITVLRYVERNPLRAKLVDLAQAWKWCSLYRFVAQELDKRPPRPPLSDWPVEQPSDSLDFVNTPQTAAEEEAVRVCIRKSRPFGAESWQQRTARRLGLKSCFRDGGRPKRRPAGAGV
jgi:putative transposase